MARITKADLDRHRRLGAEAADLSRRARVLRQEIAKIEKRAEADLVASGRPAITRGGYRIDWSIGRAAIKWRSELLAAIGIDGVTAIEENADEVRRLAIHPPPS